MAERLLICCLCAAWCRVCDSYLSVFASVADRNPDVEFRILDVEEAGEIGDLVEVESFPTLLIFAGTSLQFVGVVSPQGEMLELLLRKARLGELPPAQGSLGATTQRLLGLIGS